MERFAIKLDEDAPLNLCKMCRLCGTINTGKIPILQNNLFHMEDGDPELWKKILACVGIQVHKDDRMPQNVCALCHDKILDFYEFREMCISIDLQTRKMLGLPSIEIKKIEDHLIKIYTKQTKKRKTTEPKFNLSTSSSAKQSKLMKIENNSIYGNNLDMKKNHTLVNMIKDEDIATNSSITNLKKRKASAPLKNNKNKKQMIDVKTEKGINYNRKKSRKCDICGQIISIPKYDEHLITSHVPRIVPYHCVRCDETITKKAEMKNHNLWHKLSRTPYTCGRCKKNVETLVGYTRHINDCLTLDKGSNLKKPLINCPNCTKTFISASNATRHIVRCKIKYENITETIIKQENSIDKAFTENNACVLIPSSVTNIRSSASSSPSTNIESLSDKSKKSKKLTKKDMQRFDNLLKNTYETLQSIKQEPKDNHDIDTTTATTTTTTTTTTTNIGNAVTETATETIDSNRDEIEKNSYVDDGVENDNCDNDGGINNDNNDDYYSSDNNDNDDVSNDLSTSVNVKQEYLEIHDTVFEKDINESTNNITTLPSMEVAETTEMNAADTAATDADKQQSQPTIKLKIKKEHGTLNSLIVGDSTNNSEDVNSKKKKRKKKKSGDKDINETAETMGNIKQEPQDDDDDEDEQTNQNQKDCTETETDIDNNLPYDNDNRTSLLNSGNNNSITAASAATSSFAIEANQNSGIIKLPIISSVHSGITIKQEIPDDFENLRHVVIKQEKPDENYENLSGLMEVNDADRNNSVLTVSNSDSSNNLQSEDNLTAMVGQIQESQPASATVSSSNNTIINNTIVNNTINQTIRKLFKMETVQIKREIINEDYTNPVDESDDGQNDDNDDENLRRILSSVVVKQEIQMNYDDVNNEINTGSEKSITSAANDLVLNQYDIMLDPNIAVNIKKEKNDEINSNSDLCDPTSDTNVFQFKKIVLRTSSVSNELDEREKSSDKSEQENNATTNEDNSTINNQCEKQDRDSENRENTETETEITKQACIENDGDDDGNNAGDDELVTKSNDCGSSEEKITKNSDDNVDDDDDNDDNELVTKSSDCGSNEDQITKNGDDNDDVNNKPSENLVSDKEENYIEESEIISKNNDLEMKENDSEQQNESESELKKNDDNQSSTELKIDSGNDNKISKGCDEIADDNLVKMNDSIEMNTEIQKIETPEISIASVLCGTQVDEFLKTKEDDDDDDDVIAIEDEELLEANEDVIEIEDDDDDDDDEDDEDEDEDEELENANEKRKEIEEQENINQKNIEEEQEKAKFEQEELKEIEDSNKELNVEQQQCNNDILPIVNCPVVNSPLPSTSHDFEMNNSNLIKNTESDDPDSNVNIEKKSIESMVVVKKEIHNYEEIIEIESDDDNDEDIEDNSQQIETKSSSVAEDDDDVVATNDNLNENENDLKLINDNNSADNDNNINNETALKDSVVVSCDTTTNTSPLESDGYSDNNQTIETEQTTTIPTAVPTSVTPITNNSNLNTISIRTMENLEATSTVTTITASSSISSLPSIDDNTSEIAENSNNENIEKELMNNDDGGDE